jgi:hypothetical protein
MFLRTLLVTVTLAVGLGVILALAFVLCIPAYLLNLMTPPPQPRSRHLARL